MVFAAGLTRFVIRYSFFIIHLNCKISSLPPLEDFFELWYSKAK